MRKLASEAGKQSRRRKRAITSSSGTEGRKGGGMTETGVGGEMWVERGRNGNSRKLEAKKSREIRRQDRRSWLRDDCR